MIRRSTSASQACGSTSLSLVVTIIEGGHWVHSRRKFFALAELTKAPLGLEAVRRIDAIFAIEREVNGHAAAARRAFGGRC